MPSAPFYCIDTSSIIHWFVETYSPDIIPGLQTRIEELIAAGRLRSPKAVLDEINPGDALHDWCKAQTDDALHDWCKAQTDLFVEEAAAVQRIVRQLMATHHNPQKPDKGINGADPFVIAVAKDGGAQWTVVSDENPGSARRKATLSAFLSAYPGRR